MYCALSISGHHCPGEHPRSGIQVGQLSIAGGYAGVKVFVALFVAGCNVSLHFIVIEKNRYETSFGKAAFSRRLSVYDGMHKESRTVK